MREFETVIHNEGNKYVYGYGKDGFYVYINDVECNADEVFEIFQKIDETHESDYTKIIISYFWAIMLDKWETKLFERTFSNFVAKLLNIGKINPIQKVFELSEEHLQHHKQRDYRTYLMSDASGLVKIGRSIDPYARLDNIRTGNPTAHLLAVLDIDIEKELHAQYASFKQNGEWFALSSKQLAEIISKYPFKKINNAKQITNSHQ